MKQGHIYGCGGKIVVLDGNPVSITLPRALPSYTYFSDLFPNYGQTKQIDWLFTNFFT